YQNYVAESQVGRIVSELATLRVDVDACLMDGREADECYVSWTASNMLGDGLTLDQLGEASEDGGSPVVTYDLDEGDVTITGTFARAAATPISNKTVVWERDGDTGAWTCKTTDEAKYANPACPAVDAQRYLLYTENKKMRQKGAFSFID